MRPHFTVILAGVLLLSAPALAGNVTVTNGQAGWQSTQCAAPSIPPSLTVADRMTPADDMNTRVLQYNEYVGLMQIYMECMSNEAQNDANLTAQAIVNAGQATIEQAHKSVDALGVPLKNQ